MTVRELMELLLKSGLDDEVVVSGEETMGDEASAHYTFTILQVRPGDGTEVAICLPRQLQD